MQRHWRFFLGTIQNVADENQKSEGHSHFKTEILPPTAPVFQENAKRAHLQVVIWKCALDPDPPNMDPTAFDWVRHEESQTLLPVRLPSGIEAAPAEVLFLLKCGCSTDQPCETARCGCTAAQLTCTAFCKCFMLLHTLLLPFVVTSNFLSPERLV